MSETEFAGWAFKDSYPMYLAEFLGTMLYSMTFAITTEPNTIYEKNGGNTNITYSINESYFIAPIAVGFIVIAMIYAFGHISGAHFNPAITVAVWIRGFITPIDAAIFIMVQLLGSFCGAMLAWIITDKVPYVMPGEDGNGDIHEGRCLVAEIIYSFAICLVVINVATTESQRGNFFYGVSIGMTVAAGLASVQKISGGCFNPALGTALSITHTFKDHGTIKYIWIYLLGPIIGAVIAGFSFYVINSKEVEQSKMISDQYN
eukprot:983444_1